MARRLVERIEAVAHETYAEPFLGMGGVFLRRRRVPKGEIVNDLSGDVVTLFRILQRHYVPFLDMLRYQITSRREFERLAKTDPETLTDLERAARFLYLQRASFGGKVVARTFGVSLGRSARFDITKLAPMLEAVHERLAGVVIEGLPYGKFIARYDRSTTLFYLDPPYHGHEADYGKGMFSEADFEALAAILRGLKGTFIMSLNDTPDVRRHFAWADIEEVETRYTAGGTAKAKRVQELIISRRSGTT